MQPLTSIKTKVKTIAQNGFSAIQTGKFALENPTAQTEPIAFLRIKDEKIPELSQKYCKKCGCALPYKTRQNIQTCPKWN